MCFDFMLRAVVEASASTASIARLFLCMVLGLRSVAILWLSVMAFCTGVAFSSVLAQHVSCAGKLRVITAWGGELNTNMNPQGRHLE